MGMPRSLVGIVLVTLLAGCALNPPRPPDDPIATRCLALYDELDAAVAEQGVTPSAPARIAGFPHLRVDRFLASFRTQSLNPDETAAWLTRLNALDQEARRMEWASLPDAFRTVLNRRDVPGDRISAVLARCAVTLRNADLCDPDRLALIRERARVADDYETLNQVLGLYPLTVLPVDFGVYRYQEEVHARFARPLADLPVQGVLRRYEPPAAPPVVANGAAIPRDALGIPEPTPVQAEALFTVHAPIWEVDVATTDDRPGAPYWRAEGIPTVDVAAPVVYRYLSHARWRDEPLLQLNYLIWFAARPKTGTFDLLGGPLDGVLWRVTLDRSGRPLLYDSIHACGCYHLLFPGSRLRLRVETADWAEPPLVPQPAPALEEGERVVIRLASGSHELQRVYADRPGVATALAARDYAALYATPVENGSSRSLFGPDGLVAGSERAERWLLWPTGVPSPGAMRERGRHAIAFVGRRHFDDADLLDRLFDPAEEK